MINDSFTAVLGDRSFRVWMTSHALSQAAKKYFSWTIGQACFVFRTHETGKSSSSDKLYCAKPAFRSSDFYEDNNKRPNVDRQNKIRTSFFQGHPQSPSPISESPWITKDPCWTLRDTSHNVAKHRLSWLIYKKIQILTTPEWLEIKWKKLETAIHKSPRPLYCTNKTVRGVFANNWCSSRAQRKWPFTLNHYFPLVTYFSCLLHFDYMSCFPRAATKRYKVFWMYRID